MTTQPTDEIKSLLHPNVELVVYSGIDYRVGSPEILPMGYFPLSDDEDSTDPGDTISLSLMDRWQWMVQADFPTPRSTDTRLTILQQVVQFIVETGQWTASQIDVQFTNSTKVAAQTFDVSEGSRANACIDLLESLGAEVYIERTGNPVIRYRKPVGASVAMFAGGDGGRLKKAVSTTSSSGVFNAVIGISTSTDPAVPSLTYTARITDPSHPAYERPGVVLHPTQYVSPQVVTLAQLKNATQKELSKVSRLAYQVSVTAVAADASLDASDTFTVVWPDGRTDVQQILKITHPLTAAEADSQSINGVSTRSDEDFAGMSWDDDLADMLQPPPPKREVFVGVCKVVGSELRVSWNAGEPAKATWSPSFAITLAARGGFAGVDGLKVIVLVPDKQPYILDMIIGS